MKNVLAIIKVALLASLLVCVLSTIRLIETATETLEQTKATVQQLQSELDGTSRNVNAILIQAGLASDEIRRAATEQRSYWRKTDVETQKTIRAVRQLVDRTDRELNDQTLRDLDATIVNLGSGITPVLSQATSTLAAGERTSNALTERASDPKLVDGIAQLDATARELAKTSTNVAATSDDIRAAVHRATKPASLVNTILMHALGIASQVGSILAGMVR